MPTAIPTCIDIPNVDYHLELIDRNSGERLHELYNNAQGDPAIEKEFGDTIAFYTRSRQAAIERAEQLYATHPSDRLGYLVVKTSVDESSGMTFLGITDRQILLPDDSVVDLPGINFSTWLLASSRHQRVRTNIGNQVNDIGRQLSHDSTQERTDWLGRFLFTGIRRTNSYSQAAVRALGFECMGVSVNDVAFDTWMTQTDFSRLAQS